MFKGNHILCLLTWHTIVKTWPLLGLGEERRRGVRMGVEGEKWTFDSYLVCARPIMHILQVLAHLVHTAILLYVRSSIFVTGEKFEASEIKEFAEGHTACKIGL